MSHPLYQKYSIDDVPQHVEDKIWENRAYLTIQEFVQPFVYHKPLRAANGKLHSGLTICTIRYFIASFYLPNVMGQRLHFIYRIPHWTWNKQKFDPELESSVIYSRDHEDTTVWTYHEHLPKEIIGLIDFDTVYELTSKLFSKHALFLDPKHNSWFEATPYYEFSTIDFLLDNKQQLKFLFDVTQDPISNTKTMGGFFADFMELLFSLLNLPTRFLNCTSRFVQL